MVKSRTRKSAPGQVESAAGQVDRAAGVGGEGARASAAAVEVCRCAVENMQAAVVVERRVAERERSAVRLDGAGVVEDETAEVGGARAAGLAEGAGVVEHRLGTAEPLKLTVALHVEQAAGEVVDHHGRGVQDAAVDRPVDGAGVVERSEPDGGVAQRRDVQHPARRDRQRGRQVPAGPVQSAGKKVYSSGCHIRRNIHMAGSIELNRDSVICRRNAAGGPIPCVGPITAYITGPPLRNHLGTGGCYIQRLRHIGVAGLACLAGDSRVDVIDAVRQAGTAPSVRHLAGGGVRGGAGEGKQRIAVQRLRVAVIWVLVVVEVKRDVTAAVDVLIPVVEVQEVAVGDQAGR